MTAHSKLIVGPPGCGKTTALVERVKEEIADLRTLPDRIAYWTFSKAAQVEVTTRLSPQLGLGPDSLPWVKTIHATALRLLQRDLGTLMTGRHWTQFAAKYGFELSHTAFSPSESGLTAMPSQTDDDRLRSVHEWSRNLRISEVEAMARYHQPIPRPRFLQYCASLKAFKRSNGLFDFTDLLEGALKSIKYPDVEVAFIDEAQDLSPLQIAVIEKWCGARTYKRVYVAGDDDQTIYGFQGADPQWLMSLARKHPTEKLTQSHRIPRQVHAMAQRIIRQNSQRVPKEYHPRAAEGCVERICLDAALRQLDGNVETLVIARNRWFLDRVAEYLRERGLPFTAEGKAAGPLDSKDVFGAVATAVALQKREPVSVEALRAMLSYVPADAGLGLLKQGTKARVNQLASTTLDRTEVERLLAGGRLLSVIDAEGPLVPLKRLDADTLAYVGKILKRDGRVSPPKIKLNSIHGVKGQEAHTVVLLPDMTKAAHDEYLDTVRGGQEAENRVAYVGVTRARERLIVTLPEGGRFYPYPSVR